MLLVAPNRSAARRSRGDRDSLCTQRLLVLQARPYETQKQSLVPPDIHHPVIKADWNQ